ncbi:MAG: glycoside hydrolase [Anaerolineaceae bacterium]|nr:glycoside hydrolase [Anaerolineaceae bacterium]
MEEMMKQKYLIIQVLLVMSLILTACGNQPEPTSTVVVPTDVPLTETIENTSVPEPSPAEDVLYLNLVWHQHQPLYYKDENGVYTRPWVRAHATKDYLDMATVIAQYPNVHATFNITPVLIKQLDDMANNGAIDKYWEYALINAEELNSDQKEFILQRFFDANWDHIIARFPRYQELLDLRGGSDAESIQKAIESYSVQDFRDLQVWFNLAWFDPDFLAEEPLKSLVEKQRDFQEEDKTIVFSEALRIIQEVIPYHKQLQESGQIEVITTPYAHPILPLLIDSNLATVGNPGAETPPQFSYPVDALAHLNISAEMYEQHYGTAPRGLWPGEGSVAQIMVPFVLKAGYQWMATGEPVLAKSLGMDSFTRNAQETVLEADKLYRPYYVTNKDGDQLAVFFRDGVISDKIGFTYSGVSGTAAAKDFMNRLENIREELKKEEADGPHIVSVILDGENAWENYENDGKEFFHALYQMLSESETIATITPSDYLEKFPQQEIIEDLFPGAWFSPNYDTWIGEPEETMAWDYLGRTRSMLAKYDISKVREAAPEKIKEAEDYMYLAEGSDWFWWYGADQDSGQDEYFDEGYRALLRKVYETLDEPVPTFINIPIIQAKSIPADVPVNGFSSPQIDGLNKEGEWDNAGIYFGSETGNSQGVLFTNDEKNIYFQIGIQDIQPDSQVSIYLKTPRGSSSGYPFTLAINGQNPELLGLAATLAFSWTQEDGLTAYSGEESGWIESEHTAKASAGDNILEIEIPFEMIGELESGDEIRFIVNVEPDGNRVPLLGPGQLIMPDLGNSTVVMEVIDPENDDYGPGTYTYPTDAVFVGKAYDLKSFRVAYDENNIIFKVETYGAIPNPWGSPNNLAIQTIDIYIDVDPGAATGERKLLPGRNLSLESENGWEYALWAEGWTPQILRPDEEGIEPKPITDAEMKIIVDPAGRSVTIRVPKTVFGNTDPSQWGYAVVILGQEGYPTAGVWRVRDVEESAAQWRFGGAPADSNHTRVLDMIWPEDGTPSQAEMLSNYVSSTASADELTADDYALIMMLNP